MSILSSKDTVWHQITPLLTFRESLAYIKKPSQQQLPWLLGRLAAKTIVTRYFEKTCGHAPSPKHIDIYNSSSGLPKLRLVGGMFASPVHLSISHTTRYGAAALIPTTQGRGIGIDIEMIRIFPVRTLRSFLTDNEYLLYSRAELELQPTLSTLYWSIKESYLKAIGAGLRIHPQKIEVSFDSSPERSVRISHSGLPTGSSVYYGLCQDDHVITSVIL